MGLFKKIYKTKPYEDPRPIEPPPAPKPKEDNMGSCCYSSSEVLDKRMKAAGYEPLDLNHQTFHEEIRYQGRVPVLYPGVNVPKLCQGCGAPPPNTVNYGTRCKYCGTIFVR